jgi:tetratricopeptide (TPR) repeat protein
MTSRAHALKDLGDVLLRLGRFEEAAKFSAEAARCFWQPIKDEISEAEARLCQGAASLAIGDPATALVSFHRASECFRAHENLAGLAAALNGYGCAEWSFGHGERAVELLREAADCAEEAGDDGLRAEVVDNLVSAYTNLGRTEEAARLAPAHGARPLPPPPGTPPPGAPADGGDGGRRRRFGWPSRRR